MSAHLTRDLTTDKALAEACKKFGLETCLRPAVEFAPPAEQEEHQALMIKSIVGAIWLDSKRQALDNFVDVMVRLSTK